MTYSLFGTDGIRGTVGNEPFTNYSLIKLGNAIARWAQQKYGAHPTFLLAHDTRISCSLVKSSLKSGLLLSPIHLYDAHILPSPAVLRLMQLDKQFDCGIIISASHNPYQDNGIKIIDTTTGKLSGADEQIITDIFYNQMFNEQYATLGVEKPFSDASERYINNLVSLFPKNFLQGNKIVLDCAHGATYKVAPIIFERLGAHVTILHDYPNGININKQCGSLFPDTLQQTVISQQATIGFAFDGDGDRVIAVNKYGQIKNGDDMLALLSTLQPYDACPVVVGTVMSNQGFEIFLRNNHKQLVRTAVGDKFIAEHLSHNGLLLGGEPSGHIIMYDYLPTGDGIFTALRTVQAIQKSDNWEMKTFTKFPQVIINLPVKIKKDLASSPIADLIAESTKQLHVGRLVVRYSGTEPLLRIMIEDDDCDHAHMIGTSLSKTLLQEIS